jgi:hypothetical protein
LGDARIAPSIENLLLLAQPAMNTASSVADPTAKKKSMPPSILNAVMFLPYGITPKVRMATAARITGARKCTTLVCARRHDIFLDQHFDSICDRLEQAKWPDAIRPVTILHSC